MSDLAEKGHGTQSDDINTSHDEHIQKTLTVDTHKNDEGLEVIAKYQGDEAWTDQEERNLVRKIDWRLLSILVLTFGLQFYDKALLSQAAIFGLRSDLKLDEGIRFSMASSIFYLGYISGAYPAIVLAQKYPIERVIFGIVFLWGVCVTAAAGCTNWQGLYAQRFFLGFLEAGVSPTWMVVVGGWYKKQEQALRMGIWFSAAPFASMVSPLINYGIGHARGALSPWRYMFLVAGAITILWSLVVLLCMDPDPTRAKRLNEREKYIAVARLRANNTGVRNTHFKTQQLWELLLDVKFWLVFSMGLLQYIANGPLTTFTPIIINSMDFSRLNSLLLTIPVGFVGGVMTIITTWVSRKIKNSSMYLVVVTACITILSSGLLWRLPPTAKGARLFGLIILSIFPSGYAILMSISMANTAGYTKRSLASSGLFVGYCFGNFIGPLVFKQEEAPGYTTGWITVLVTAAVGGLLALVYRFLCVWENKKRDNTGVLEDFEHAYEDDLTDKTNMQFRYSY